MILVTYNYARTPVFKHFLPPQILVIGFVVNACVYACKTLISLYIYRFSSSVYLLSIISKTYSLLSIS